MDVLDYVGGIRDSEDIMVKNMVGQIVEEVDAKWKCSEKMIAYWPKGNYNCYEFKHSSENEVLFSAHYGMLLLKLGFFEDDMVQHQIEKDCTEYALNGLRVKKGVFNSHFEFNRDPVSWDNYVGITTLSWIFNMQVSAEICQHGLETGWSFNNDPSKPEWDLRQTRQGKETGFYKVTSGYKPTVIEWAWMLGAVWATAKKDDLGPDGQVVTSGKLMMWLKLEVLREEYPIWEFVWEWYVKQMKKYYGKRWLESMFAIYFPVEKTIEEHPLRKLARLYQDELDLVA